MPPTTHRRKTTQRKISQKELKQPDEFTTLFESAQNFILGNLRQVFISAGIVVAIGAVAIGVYYYEQHLDAVASTQFYSALAALKGGQYKAAETQFQKLADEGSSRRLGRLARFYTASAYLGDNDLPKARDALVAFLAEERDPLFTSLALTNLAVVYERMSDWKKAGGAYRQAAGIDGPEQMRSQLGVARMLAKMGDKEGAVAAYRGFLMAHPYAQQREDVLASLALLGAPAVPPPPALATTSASSPLPVITH